MEERQSNLTCILCNKSTPELDRNNEGQNCSKKFIQLLLKFLNIRSKLEENNNSDFSKELRTCDDCFKLGESFCDLYSKWVYLRLHLELKVREVCDVIKHAGRTFPGSDEQEMVSLSESNGISNENKNLRGELLEGYKNKLNSSFPRNVSGKIPEEEENDEKQAENENGPVPSVKPNKRKRPSTPEVVDLEKNVGNEFKCSKCAKTFDEEIWLNVHLQVHHSSLSRHDEHHIDNNMNDSSIDLNTVAATVTNTIRQCNSDPPATPRSPYCYKCQSTFDSQVLLTVHLRVFHQIRASFECPLCGIKRKGERAFRMHMKLVHNTVSGLPGFFKCPKCEERYINEAGLKIHHTKTHEFYSDLKSKSFNCDFEGCTKKFKTSSQLKNHRRVHTSEKPYQCWWPSCSTMFKDSSNRWQHYRRHSINKSFSRNSRKHEQQLSAKLSLKRYGNEWKCERVTNKKQKEFESEEQLMSGNHVRCSHIEIENTEERKNRQQTEKQTQPSQLVQMETPASTLDSSNSKDQQGVGKGSTSASKLEMWDLPIIV